MWMRGKDQDQAGAFAYELWDESRLLHRRGGFPTAQAADRAAERAQRDFLQYGIEAPPPDVQMTDEELFAALSGE